MCFPDARFIEKEGRETPLNLISIWTENLSQTSALQKPGGVMTRLHEVNGGATGLGH
jgi:hypothetical protein